MNTVGMNATISPEAQALMAPDSKIGLIATEGAEGYPHITFISSVQGYGEDRISFGSFCVGYSKRNLTQGRPDAAFLALTTDMSWLHGAARFSHIENTGALFDTYNAKPLFRYNTYFGFDHVYVLDLLAISPVQKLSMPAIVVAALTTRALAAWRSVGTKAILRPFATQLISTLDSLVFIAWRPPGAEVLELIPIIQATAAGTDRIAFTGGPYGSHLKPEALPDGTKAAIICLNLQLQSVEVEGLITRKGPLICLDIERVYNSMPPKMEYIYPRPARPEAVTAF